MTFNRIGVVLGFHSKTDDLERKMRAHKTMQKHKLILRETLASIVSFSITKCWLKCDLFGESTKQKLLRL